MDSTLKSSFRNSDTLYCATRITSRPTSQLQTARFAKADYTTVKFSESQKNLGHKTNCSEEALAQEYDAYGCST